MCFAESARLTVTPRPVTGTKKHNSTEVSIRLGQAKLKKERRSKSFAKAPLLPGCYIGYGKASKSVNSRRFLMTTGALLDLRLKITDGGRSRTITACHYNCTHSTGRLGLALAGSLEYPMQNMKVGCQAGSWVISLNMARREAALPAARS